MWDIFSVLIGSTGHSPTLEVGRYFKGPVNKYFWLYGPLGLHHNCSVLPDSNKVTMDNVFSDKFSNKSLLTKFMWLVGFDSLLSFHYRVENLISLCLNFLLEKERTGICICWRNTFKDRNYSSSIYVN